MTVTVAVLGSTGSIGTQTLDVVRSAPGRYRVESLAAARSVDLIAAQAEEFRPRWVALVDGSRARELAGRLPEGTELVVGSEALADLARRADVTVNAVVGFAGLGVTLAALAAGKRLALANKESLIAAGPVVQPLRDTPGAELIPVDSEHCAIHQCLRAARRGPDGRTMQVSRLVVTASGGPFRGRSAAELGHVTLEEALNHPTWSMGPKITVDSSTLMNKGLEVIEAHELFGVDYDDIDVVVHPQSIVHSMVEYTDGSTIAQISRPDMRLPIGYALAYPDRLDTAFGAMDWTGTTRLDFEPPDRKAFRCLDLAYRAGRTGGGAPAFLSAANEVAVEAFLAGRIGWSAIAEIVEDSLDRYEAVEAVTVEEVLLADAAGRREARASLAAR